MQRLSKLLEQAPFIMFQGPFSVEIGERIAEAIKQSPQIMSGSTSSKRLGHACSALLSRNDWPYIEELTDEYIRAVPSEQPLILLTNSFSLPKAILKAAAREAGIDPALPREGLSLVVRATKMAKAALKRSGRSLDDSLIAASIGPPFDCYRGEDTPLDVVGAYSPQVFSTIRFCPSVDYLLFETVPSLRAAVGAAEAFKQAHGELNVPQQESLGSTDLLNYLGVYFEATQMLEKEREFCPTYNPDTQVFSAIPEPKMEYMISLCLEEDGRLHNGEKKNPERIPLSDAIGMIEKIISDEGLPIPVGFGINCNSIEVTEKALDTLSSEAKQRVISIHPNATSENNPRLYEKIKKKDAITPEEYVGRVVYMAKRHNLKVVGGCCGTEPEGMKMLYERMAA